MKLGDVILNCANYEDTDDSIHMVFAKRIGETFEPQSEAVVLALTADEMEMDLEEISNLKCPGYDYFLELFILQDFYNDLKDSEEYKTDNERVKRVIYYAEYDA